MVDFTVFIAIASAPGCCKLPVARGFMVYEACADEDKALRTKRPLARAEKLKE
jgi:hypothetical protein